MKRVIAIFVWVFVIGIAVGGAYGLIFRQDSEKVNAEATSQAESALQDSSEPQKSEQSTEESQSSSSKMGTVTNPNKVCSTPGCGKAVFVTYKGKELCVSCYGEAKNRDSSKS